MDRGKGREKKNKEQHAAGLSKLTPIGGLHTLYPDLPPAHKSSGCADRGWEWAVAFFTQSPLKNKTHSQKNPPQTPQQHFNLPQEDTLNGVSPSQIQLVGARLRALCPARAEAASGFLWRGVDRDTAVNLHGKLIKASTTDSCTSSPRNFALSPPKLPHAPGGRERERKKTKYR